LGLANRPLVFRLSGLDTPPHDRRFGPRQLTFDRKVEVDTGGGMKAP
jgi:hypothetical protein